MKIECNNIRYVDELKIVIKLTKQNIAELLSSGKIYKDLSFNDNKEIRIDIELDLNKVENLKDN